LWLATEASEMIFPNSRAREARPGIGPGAGYARAGSKEISFPVS